MPTITIPPKFKTTQYYDTYKAIKGLGLTTEQAIEETNLLFIETYKCQ